MTENSSEISQVLAQLAVSDMEASVAWTRQILGQPESDRPMDGLTSWYLDPAGVLQLTYDPDRAGGSTVSLVVPDIAATRDRIVAEGIEFEIEESTSDKFRLGVLTDPDGNSVTFVEIKISAG